MQAILSSVALGLAAVGLLYSNLTTLVLSPAQPRRLPTMVQHLLIAAGTLTALLFLLTLPAKPPFSPGMTLGWGFLIGGAIGLYAAFEASRPYEGPLWLSRAVGLLSAATLGVSLILLIFRGYPNEALAGYALAAALVASVWRSCAGPEHAAGSRDEAAADRAVEAFALAAVAMAAGARLAVEHYSRAHADRLAEGYWALPLLLGAVGALAAVIPGRQVGTAWPPLRYRPLTVGVVATTAVALVSALLAWKLFRTPAPSFVVICGASGFALAAWLATEADDFGPMNLPRPTGEAFGVALLALALVAVSFKLLHGYGEALALCGGLPFVAVLAVGQARSRDAIGGPLLSAGFTIVLLLALYRVFLETSGPHEPLDLQPHYNYFGIALGALGGLGLIAYGRGGWERSRQAAGEGRRLTVSLARTVALGLAVSIAPLALAVTWGLEALSGFLIGLVAAELVWIASAAWSAGEDRVAAVASAPHPYLVGAALVAIEFSPVVMPVAGAGRAAKAIIVGAILFIALAWVVAAALVRHGRPVKGGEGGG